VTLRGRGRESEEHELRHTRAALQPVAARVQHRHETLAAPGIARVPDRAMDRDAGAEKARSRARERHEGRWKIPLLAVREHIRAPVQIPPAILVRLDILACRRLADVVGRAEQARRGEPLHAIDAKIHPVWLALEVDVGVLDAWGRRGQCGTELLAGEHGHRTVLWG